MRLLALRAGLKGCLIFVTSTHAAPAEKLITEVPKHWVKTLDRRLGNLHLVEYYPPGPDENWTEKLTIEVLSTPTPGDPLQHAQALADTQRNQCARFSDHGVFAGIENNYPTNVTLQHCVELTEPRGTLSRMLKIIQGQQALYTVVRAARFKTPNTVTPGAATRAPVDPSMLKVWSTAMRKTVLCNPVLNTPRCNAAFAQPARSE